MTPVARYEIEKVRSAVPGAPTTVLSVARIVTLAIPGVVKVPEISPDRLRLRPGILPAIML